MRLHNHRLTLAPTDLSGYLNCRHLTALDLRAAKGEFDRPKVYGPVTEALQRKGLEHERGYLAHLKSRHPNVVALEDHAPLTATRAAMAAGADVIYQARLEYGGWSGYADFLVKVPTPSNLGDWSYEAQDTKLARTTRAGTILQLCVYTLLLEHLQGVRPEHMHVVAPGRDWQPETYRVDEYAAYFRLLERGITAFTGKPDETYPELVSHCDLCAYWERCEQVRRADDQLCYVAGMQAGHIEQLRAAGIGSLRALAEAEDVPKPSRGSIETLTKLRDQARIQLRGRNNRSHEFELKRPFDAEHGFQRLPEPTPDDIYLDFEGSHFTEGGVQEYLTGYVTVAADGSYHYTGLWADTLAAEQAAFEGFIDLAMAVRARNPKAHIYHFAPYEPAALKRLMGRFATRERELDVLLREEAFVDLHGVVRRSLIASVEAYSIKNLEPFFGYSRGQDLRAASAARRAIEAALEYGPLDEAVAEAKRIVTDYNREDCESTHRLHVWLEALRAEAETAHGPIPRLVGHEQEEKSPKALDAALEALRDALIAGIPTDPAEQTADQRARFLLGHLMEFHRREEKATWWEYFRLRDLPAEELIDERKAMSGLVFQEIVDAKAAPLIRYRFAAQDADARDGENVYDPDGNQIGTVAAVDHNARSIDIKHGKVTAEARPDTVFFHSYIDPGEIRQSLMRLGEHVLEQGLAPAEPYASALRLLAREVPGRPGAPVRAAKEPVVDAAVRAALALDHGVLAIQGPPGTGKTFTGGEIICALVAAGRTVGITAVGHTVIHNLLEQAAEAAAEKDMKDLGLHHRYSGGSSRYEGDAPITNISSYDKVLDGLRQGSIRVVGGTQWMWSREDFVQAVDVLIVDEAGQMALANVLAAAPAAKSLILLGDPQQLEQPIQSAHPQGSDVAALKHWLGEHETMPADRGLFLDETWRLHPEICAFTSEIYYEDKLAPKADLVHQAIGGDPPLHGAGLRYVPVVHSGNTARSTEEVEAIAAIVDRLTAAGAIFTDRHQATRPLSRADVLIVAPYNAQVAALKARLPDIAERIGTVDKFQGQEAPVVIYSMTSSSPDDAPRGMEFLYNPNRFNVATSRAKALCILVGSPRLLEPLCRTPRQMKMANGFCRFGELAERVVI
ncbi:MAG: TM0106 family RecB-like putative nuclease [Pseudomonadales bacterium]